MARVIRDLPWRDRQLAHRDARQLQLHEIADPLDRPELRLRGNRARRLSAGMSARTASTKPAVSRSAGSASVATRMPLPASRSSIWIAFCSSTVDSDRRSSVISSAKLVRRSSCT